ncbi:MAG TPA: hypothetical protein VJU13_00160 [Candidatus Nitrosocosmicus sp.]|nr:hypothetical protein [Candidatus Nitrosocosmicus sp.]
MAESEIRKILELSISTESTMLITKQYLSTLVDAHGKFPISRDGTT